MKKYLLLFITLILISSVYAYPCVRHTFKELGTNLPITNVKWEVWACGDSECTTINPTYWHQSGNSGTNNYADIKFRPTLPSSGRYLVLLFHDNFLSRNVRWNVYWAEKTNPDSCDRYSTWDTSTSANHIFEKKANGKAPVTLIVQNKIGEWLPLTIDTTSQLDTETASAIHTTTTVYLPTTDPNFADYFKVATNLNLQITDKKTNSIVYQQSRDLMIPWDSTLPSSFSWSPTDSSYKSGNYTVTLTSHVSDSKCSSFIDDVKQQDIEVFPELPNDACVTVAKPVSLLSPIVKGQEGQLNITSYFYHLIKTYDSDYNMHLTYKGITANYRLTLTNKSNKVDRILTGSFPKSFTDERTDVAPAKPMNMVLWTPRTYGEYNVKLELTSTDQLCLIKANDFSLGTRPTDKVTVTIRDQDDDTYKEDVDCNDQNPDIHPC